ncbi:MAG: zinc-binding metallopeptidase family protein [Anaerolineae bacterium]
MQDILRSAIAHEFNLETLEALTRRIAGFERSGSYQRFGESASYCAEELRKAGLSGVEEISLPADGESTHMDFTMPQAWEATEAELAIVEPAADAVPLIDYASMPLCLANRCGPTPPEGVLAEVITAEELWARESAPGVLVYTNGKPPQTWRPEERDPALCSNSLRAVAAAKGALGLISDFSPAREMDPDATYWINGWGSPGWYTTREDMPLCCFSITPAKGALLADLLHRGPVRVFAKVQSRLYDGAIKTVTALIPGRQEREIVLMAHIYEPFMGDDAIGAAALIEIGRTIITLQKKGVLPPLELGIRLLIGMERYGFAAYFKDEARRKRALLGISMDAIGLPPELTKAAIEVRLSPPSMPFWGDLLLRRLAQDTLTEYPIVTVPGTLSDDTFISDRTIGIPTQWVWTRVGATHHSSLWLQEEFNDWHLGSMIARLIISYIVRLTTTKQQNTTALLEAMEQSLTGEGAVQVAEWIESLSRNGLSLRQVKRQSEQWFLWQRGRIESFAGMFPDVDLTAIRDVVENFEHTLETVLSHYPEDSNNMGPMEAEAHRTVLLRTSLGIPASQARVPWGERIAESHEQALNWADGVRTVSEIAALAQPLATPAEEEEWLRRFMRYCRLMAKYGYLELIARNGAS